MNTVIICQDCGHQNAIPSNFCSICGHRLQNNSNRQYLDSVETEPYILTDIEDKFSNITLNDKITFGRYPQSSGTENRLVNCKEDILWRVLAIEDDKALLITDKILDSKPYNESRRTITWEHCSLRKWLNKDFYIRAFSVYEKDIIATTKVKNDNNPRYKTAGGNETQDKVFLLSFHEAELYFENDKARAAQGTAFSKGKGMYVSELGFASGNSRWWLRSPGGNQTLAGVVNYLGYIYYISYNVSYEQIGVRPAIWVNI